MRLVHEQADLANAIKLARAEAEGAFGSGELILEKAIIKPRHVEIQVFADTMGNTVHLGERDCSVQRRHQKVVEEAPAPGITEEQRAFIGARCAKACSDMGYEGAGTFEFLYENNEFYFIEMNTRVQVEHPVTEAITGLDLIALQIAIAEGQPLPMTQADIRLHGHAVECRLNAEDIANNFMPNAGRVTQVWFPSMPSLRVDTYLQPGAMIPPYYDSMVAKLIAWGDTREAAIAVMQDALKVCVLDGVKTNIPLHAAIMDDPIFRAGGVDTTYMAGLLPTLTGEGQ